MPQNDLDPQQRPAPAPRRTATVSPRTATGAGTRTVPRTAKSNNPVKEEKHTSGNTAFSAFLVITIALGFLAYIFNVAGFATGTDSFFNNLNGNVQAQNDSVVKLTYAAIPVAGGIICLLLIYGIFKKINKTAKSIDKSRKLANREVVTLDKFQEMTFARGIRPRISQQAYKLLESTYRKSMRIRLDDRLKEDLKLSPTEINNLRGNLLRNTDRKENPNEPFDTVYTVMDLLNYAQNANKVSRMDSMVIPAAGARPDFVKPAKLTPAPRPTAEPVARATVTPGSSNATPR